MALHTVPRASRLYCAASSGVGGPSFEAVTEVFSSWGSSSLVAAPGEARPGTLCRTAPSDLCAVVCPNRGPHLVSDWNLVCLTESWTLFSVRV